MKKKVNKYKEKLRNKFREYMINKSTKKTVFLDNPISKQTNITFTFNIKDSAQIFIYLQIFGYGYIIYKNNYYKDLEIDNDLGIISIKINTNMIESLFRDDECNIEFWKSEFYGRSEYSKFIVDCLLDAAKKNDEECLKSYFSYMYNFNILYTLQQYKLNNIADIINI